MCLTTFYPSKIRSLNLLKYITFGEYGSNHDKIGTSFKNGIHAEI